MKKQGFCALLALLTALSALAGCGVKEEVLYTPTGEKIEGSSLYVKKVENLADDFILGMDASSVIAEEASGVKYRNFDGNEQDVFLTLAQNGINYIRVRVWNDPFDEKGNGYGGGNCDIDTALAIGKRATRYGMKLLVDFHYSDFWADPGKQMVPRQWEGMRLDQKADALYDYTRDCLKKLRRAGVDVGMVQLGNETNGALCGETAWDSMSKLFRSGAKAVRQVFPDALVAVHFANPEKEGSYADYAKKLQEYEVDYDVFASSYYPFWHGTLENLSQVLTHVHETYGKQVMVMETSYAYTPEDTDFFGNTVSEDGAVTQNYPYTVQGQAASVRDVIETVANIPGGMGVCYWEGTWITVGQNSWEENREKWEKYGSGWATSHAANYDPNDAGKYYGGCAVDNQAMFGPDGHPLESLRVFNLVRHGNETAPRADAVIPLELSFETGKPITLPETVEAVLTDGSRRAVEVEWGATEQALHDMQTQGEAVYTLVGTAEGLEARLTLRVVDRNYLENGGFESGDTSGWTVTDLGKTEQLYPEAKQTDSLEGSWHMHFWSAARDSVEFKLEQAVSVPEPGDYRFSVSIMGGDGGETEIYAYVLRNGEALAWVPMKITSYGQWDSPVLTGLRCADGDTLTVGIYVKCRGAGNGAWGKIDNAFLKREIS